MESGLFVTIEGLDGAGKDTVLERIDEAYEDVVITTEPSTLWTGKQVRKCLSDESSDPLTDFYFFMGDRVNHIRRRVEPALEDGHMVVSGRYADSTRAYQPVAMVNKGAFDDMDEAKHFIEETMRPWNVVPDLTIYLAVDPTTAYTRCSNEEKYEKLEFLRQVNENYWELIEGDDEGRWEVVDATQPPEAVAAEVLMLINKRLK